MAHNHLIAGSTPVPATMNKKQLYTDKKMLEVYYAEKYGKKMDEEWPAFWKRVNKMLIRKGRDRREWPIFRGDIYRTS